MEGRVIRIFDEQRVALNIGSNDGVESGMEFDIYAPGDTITDPDTEEELGIYRLRKARVIAREVFPRFTVASAPTRRQRVDEPSGNINALFRQPRYRNVPGRLPVDEFDLEPVQSGSSVKVGDLVVLVPQEAPD